MNELSSSEFFDPGVSIYLTTPLVSRLMRYAEGTTPDNRATGFIMGEVVVVDDKEYVVGKAAVSQIDEVEALPEPMMIVGLFHSAFQGDKAGLASAVEKEMMMSPGDHHFMASVDYDNWEIKTLKKGGKLFITAPYKEIPFEESPVISSEEILEEVSELRAIRMNIEFLALAFFAAIFGVFGGAVGLLYFIRKDRFHAAITLTIGLLSTFAWMVVGHGLI